MPIIMMQRALCGVPTITGSRLNQETHQEQEMKLMYDGLFMDPSN